MTNDTFSITRNHKVIGTCQHCNEDLYGSSTPTIDEETGAKTFTRHMDSGFSQCLEELGR